MIKGPCSTQQPGHNGLKLVSNLRLRAEGSLPVSDRREASTRCLADMVANGKAAMETV